VESLDDKYLRDVYDQAKQYEGSIDLGRFQRLFELPFVDGFTKLRSEIINKFRSSIPKRYHEGLSTISNEGNLSERLINSELSSELYEKMIDCLHENAIYKS
jgi:hypothetical protein